MRIISWNVNGIRAVEKKWEIQNFIETYTPDILFLQEIKAKPDQLSEYLLTPENYRVHYNPAEKAWYAGTGVWIHRWVSDIADIRFLDSFPEDPTANEGRVAHIEMTVGGEVYDIFGIYFPNGGKSEEAWQGKLVFYAQFASYMDMLRSQGHHVLWWGDLNCAHHEIDLARPKANEGKIGFHPLERAWLDGRVNDGWSDIFRTKYGDIPDVYSWWDVITRSRLTNVGWRIDAWWGSEGVTQKTKNVEYLWNQMGSDHCPISIEIDI